MLAVRIENREPACQKKSSHGEIREEQETFVETATAPKRGKQCSLEVRQ